MSRALVLGGGGPVGIAWEAGLIVGLAGKGVDLGLADHIVGTSAGSHVGAQLALGHDLEAAVRGRDDLVTPDDSGASNSASGASMADRLFLLMEQMAILAAEETVTEAALARLGRFALEQDTGTEEDFTSQFIEIAGAEWPPRFACTAIDVVTGEFTVWDQASGVDLQLAVASSCAVPGLFPPITIGAARYMDGGMRSPLNSDLVNGYDRVVVVSCMGSATLPKIKVEIDQLSESGSSVELIEPDQAFTDISGAGMHLMDESRIFVAFDAGVSLGSAEADRVGAMWDD